MLSGEATNTNCIAFGLTQKRLQEPMSYRMRCEHANHDTTDVILT